jgi:hypothetical protein
LWLFFNTCDCFLTLVIQVMVLDWCASCYNFYDFFCDAVNNTCILHILRFVLVLQVKAKITSKTLFIILNPLLRWFVMTNIPHVNMHHQHFLVLYYPPWHPRPQDFYPYFFLTLLCNIVHAIITSGKYTTSILYFLNFCCFRNIYQRHFVQLPYSYIILDYRVPLAL